MRFTCSFSKVVHIIRSLSLDDFDGALRNFVGRFDECMKEAFDKIAGMSLDVDELIQLWLPRRLGDLGLRSAAAHTDAAFIAGSLNSAPLVKSILQAHGHGDRYMDSRLSEAIQRFNAEEEL